MTDTVTSIVLGLAFLLPLASWIAATWLTREISDE